MNCLYEYVIRILPLETDLLVSATISIKINLTQSDPKISIFDHKSRFSVFENRVEFYPTIKKGIFLQNKKTR